MINRHFHDSTKTHRYELTVVTKDGWSERWSIDANTRSQAGAIAKRNGASEVCDCNMVG